ncbi:hypothetical protein AURDEDRAFT_77679, partial [Auricularia subglabra TFB-10046 SS5]
QLYPSAAELQVLQEDFNCILDVLRQPQGLHPKLSKRMSLFLSPLHSFAHDVRQAKRRRTSERTYDATANTMFLD